MRVEKSVFVALKVYLQPKSSPGSLNYFSSLSTPCSSSSSSPSHPRHRPRHHRHRCHRCHRPSSKRLLPPFVLSTFCSSQPFKKTSSTLQKTSSTIGGIVFKSNLAKIAFSCSSSFSAFSKTSLRRLSLILLLSRSVSSILGLQTILDSNNHRLLRNRFANLLTIFLGHKTICKKTTLNRLTAVVLFICCKHN